MNPPTVSIVVPTYNREALLPRALDSVVAQTIHDWEIVLVDDGSTDGTEQVAARYLDRLGDRFVYIQQDNRGSSSARNRGIDSCRGRFVAFLDSDDEFLPHKLERQLALFKACPEAGFVYSDYAYIDSDGVYHPSAFDTNFRLGRQVPYEIVGPALCLCSREVFDVLLRGYFIATIVGMVRQQVLGETIRFGVDQAYAEEWLFYLKVARSCRVGFVDEPLSVHHFVEGSLARTDKRRNALRYCNLLLAIEDAFDDLTRKQRKVVRHNLQQARRQAGYDAQRVGRHREAFGYFAESLRCSPAPGTLSETVRAAGRWLLVGAAPPGVRKQPREERPVDARQGDIERRPDRSTQVRQSVNCTPLRAEASTIEAPSFVRTTNPDVWDRLWRHRLPDAKDNALLAREEHSPRWAMIVDRLQATFDSIEGLRTVELGSGRGDLSVLLARRGARVTLLDASEKVLTQASRRFVRLGLKARYVHADVFESLDSWQGRFDVALSSGVIEHFKGNGRILAVGSHFDVLRPGGMAVISVPHAWCAPYRMWKSYLELRGWWPYGVEIPYTRRELTRLAREVGFAQVETCCTGFWQSVGDHWGKSIFGRGPDWVDRPSRLDGVMGMTLLMFSRRGDAKSDLVCDDGYRTGERIADRPLAGPTRLDTVHRAGTRVETGEAAIPVVARQFIHRAYGREWEMEADWVRQHLPPGTGSVADIGCGIGALLPMIGASRVIGIDHYAEGLAHTRKQFASASLICADAGRLPFADGLLDAVTAQHVLEHIVNYEDTCREWLRAMKPGGTLLLLTPNRYFCDPAVFADETHVHIFDPADLRQVLRKVGFKIMDLRSLGLPWFREYRTIPAGWRLRRFVMEYANNLSSVPTWRWKGQTLCCAARKPIR